MNRTVRDVARLTRLPSKDVEVKWRRSKRRATVMGRKDDWVWTVRELLGELGVRPNPSVSWDGSDWRSSVPGACGRVTASTPSDVTLEGDGGTVTVPMSAFL